MDSKLQASIISANFKTYNLFGYVLASDFPFANKLERSTGIPDLTFTCIDQSRQKLERQQIPTGDSDSSSAGDDANSIYLRHQDNCDILSFPHVADFYISPERIICYLFDSAFHYLIEIYFLGTIMSFWLERRGIVALHASAVQVNDRALVFLSSNNGGKSSLAAAFMQLGYPLLSDDVFPVERRGDAFIGLPGYPQMRFWPDEAQYFLGRYEDLEIVHPAYSKRRAPVGSGGFGTFCNTLQPLARLYLPKRRDSADGEKEIEIAAVSPRDAVIELVRHSFVAPILETSEMQQKRLDLFARLVQKVPMRRVIYPSGLENLPHVRDVILEDFRSPS